ncbi:MAG: lytic transglycosylase domain-containing protein [Clostridia bacterium]|nr:lytic transglycosylase domain-containing protein [Clostridia bacterium]
MKHRLSRRTAGAALVAAVLLFALAAGLAAVGLRLAYPQKYRAQVLQASTDYQVPPDLLFAVIRTESSFRPGAVSSAGAQGLTQITPETFEWLCYKSGEDPAALSLFDPETAIRFGAFFLHLLLTEFEEPATALAAYHAGRGRVNGWLEDPACSADGVRLHRIPVRETAHYVQKVEHAQRVYTNLYHF